MNNLYTIKSILNLGVYFSELREEVEKMLKTTEIIEKSDDIDYELLNILYSKPDFSKIICMESYENRISDLKSKAYIIILNSYPKLCLKNFGKTYFFGKPKVVKTENISNLELIFVDIDSENFWENLKLVEKGEPKNVLGNFVITNEFSEKFLNLYSEGSGIMENPYDNFYINYLISNNLVEEIDQNIYKNLSEKGRNMMKNSSEAKEYPDLNEEGFNKSLDFYKYKNNYVEIFTKELRIDNIFDDYILPELNNLKYYRYDINYIVKILEPFKEQKSCKINKKTLEELKKFFNILENSFVENIDIILNSRGVNKYKRNILINCNSYNTHINEIDYIRAKDPIKAVSLGGDKFAIFCLNPLKIKKVTKIGKIIFTEYELDESDRKLDVVYDKNRFNLDLPFFYINNENNNLTLVFDVNSDRIDSFKKLWNLENVIIPRKRYSLYNENYPENGLFSLYIRGEIDIFPITPDFIEEYFETRNGPLRDFLEYYGENFK